MSPIVTTILSLLRPPVDAAKTYSWSKLRRDVLAALTVAVVAVPQAMAFALIAGVPPEYGLYTAIFQGLLGSLFSSSDHLSNGPTNTQSLLIAAAVHRVAGSEDPSTYVQLAIALTLLKGLIQMAFAVARMGNLVRYVSRSVIVGFTAGAGVLIAVGQLPNFLGVELVDGRTNWPGMLDSIARLWPHIDQTNPRAVAVGLAALGVVIACRRIWKLLPGPLIAVAGAALTAYLMGWSSEQLPLIGPLPSTLPHLQWPTLNWSLVEQMFGGAVAIALLGMVEAVAISKSIATQTGQRINANQEFFAQGVSNTLSSFIQCIPGSGSFSRSALNRSAGAATRFAGLFAAVFVAVAYLLLADETRYIPLTSLAAILFVVAWQLIDFVYLRRLLASSREDSIVCVITFLSTLAMPLEYALYVGVFLNIALYVRRAGQLHMNEMVQARGGPIQERPITDRSGRSSVVFLSLEGDLFFGVADELQTQLTKVSGSGVRVIILRLKRTHMIDATVLGVLDQFAASMRQYDRYVLLCGVRPELHDKLRAFGLSKTIGEENIFETQFGVFSSAKSALRRARELVGQSIDADELLIQAEQDEKEEQTKSNAIDYSI